MTNEANVLWTRKPNEVLDVRREPCPFPVLLTKNKLEQLPPGALLEVLLAHPRAATETIPGICAKKGWECVFLKEWNYWRLRVKKSSEL